MAETEIKVKKIKLTAIKDVRDGCRNKQSVTKEERNKRQFLFKVSKTIETLATFSLLGLVFTWLCKEKHAAGF